RFRELCSRDWRVEIEHTYKEENYAVDHLTTPGYDYPLGNHKIPITYNSFVYFVGRDCLGVTEPHLMSINNWAFCTTFLSKNNP
ncbi:hypothetical protein LINPERPRIM_LOCUS9362, partial [Linum perenne]